MQGSVTKSDELPQASPLYPTHPSDVKSAGYADPASSRGKSIFSTLTASSVGLEFGLAVMIGLFFGRWLDGEIGTDPYMMILFIAFGFAAGIKGLVRAVRQADREAAHGG